MRLCGGWVIVLKSYSNRFLSSLTARIFLITALILFAACAITYTFIAWATPISYQAIEYDTLKQQIVQLAAQLEQTTLEDSGPIFDRFLRDTGAELTLYGPSGAVVELPTSFKYVENTAVSSVYVSADPAAISGSLSEGQGADSQEGDDSIAVAPSAVWEAVHSRPSTASFDTNSGYWTSSQSISITVSDWSVPVCFAGSDTVYELTATAGVQAVNQATQAMGKILPYLIGVVLVISLFGALFYSRYITRPIVRLSGISQRMSELDFSWTCPETRKDEIGVLGQNLNALSRHLCASLQELQAANDTLQQDIHRERELERQRSCFFAAASHELKTPITVLRGQLSGMLAGVDVYQDRDKYLAKSLAVTGRMEKLVQEMLTISRMEQPDFCVRLEPVSLTELVQDQLSQLEDLALQRRQELHCDLAASLMVQADKPLLERAVSNLLSNAFLYSPEQAQIRVLLKDSPPGPVLEIENEGAFIPLQAQSHLFEAFYRVEASRSRETGGSGLGLYLVNMILERHGAQCRIENTPRGVLSTVQF